MPMYRHQHESATASQLMTFREHLSWFVPTCNFFCNLERIKMHNIIWKYYQLFSIVGPKHESCLLWKNKTSHLQIHHPPPITLNPSPWKGALRLSVHFQTSQNNLCICPAKCIHAYHITSMTLELTWFQRAVLEMAHFMMLTVSILRWSDGIITVSWCHVKRLLYLSGP